jgi:hypothetical protein
VGQAQEIPAAVGRERAVAVPVLRAQAVAVPVRRERAEAAPVLRAQAVAMVWQGPTLPRRDSR